MYELQAGIEQTFGEFFTIAGIAQASQRNVRQSNAAA
jgi:hypothetical protein